MSEQKSKIILAVILAAVSVSMLLGAGYRFLPSGEVSTLVPLTSPSLLETDIANYDLFTAFEPTEIPPP